MRISIHIRFFNNFSLRKYYLQNFVFEGGNNYMTVLKIFITGLLQNTEGRMSAYAVYKKTLIMILSHVNPI